jgi:hypothetical protein
VKKSGDVPVVRITTTEVSDTPELDRKVKEQERQHRDQLKVREYEYRYIDIIMTY